MCTHHGHWRLGGVVVICVARTVQRGGDDQSGMTTSKHLVFAPLIVESIECQVLDDSLANSDIHQTVSTRSAQERYQQLIVRVKNGENKDS